MPNEDSKILKYNRGEKSLKAPAIIYAGLKKKWKEMIMMWKRNDTANW